MKAEKKEVLVLLVDTILKPNERFNGLFELFRKTPGKNVTQEKYLNRVGFNQTTLDTLIYELKKLHQISDSDIKQFTVAAIEVVVDELKKERSFLDRFLEFISVLDNVLKVQLLQLIKMRIDFPFTEQRDKMSPELLSFIEDSTPFVKLKDLSPELWEEMSTTTAQEEFFKYLEDNVSLPQEFAVELESLKAIAPIEDVEAKEEVISVFQNSPDELKQEIRFRDEFPFINDPELPAELKILVTDKFNHYFAFCDAHKELFSRVVSSFAGISLEDSEKFSKIEIFELAKKAVENFEMDQLIYDEFVHFRDEKKILGAHPIFKQRKLQDQVNNMTVADAAKRAANLENYIRRDSKKALDAKTPEDKLKFEEKVVEWKTELVLVNLKLGVKDAGK